MEVDWELSQSLVSDGQGVRAACVASPHVEVDSFGLVTGTQAGGLVEWSLPSREINLISYQHNHAVTALFKISDDRYVTGCKDAMIRVMDQKTNEVLATLQGHEKPVTSFDSIDEYLVSGSWDGTAKVWKDGALVATLQGHENSVCVACLARQGSVLTIATGSAGIAQNNTILQHAIRVWTVDTVTGQVDMKHHVVQDHDGPIRNLCRLNDASFASCSNDGTVKIRDFTGQALSTLTFATQQHPPMLLSICVAQDCLIAGAEDGTVVSWSLTQQRAPQVIEHPNCVWQVLGLPNGDFASCCQDGSVYIFTQESGRIAEQAERDKFAQASQARRQPPSSDEIAKLPHWSNSAGMPGRSEGQVQIFQRDGVAIAAQWSAVSQTWIEVGQVMGSGDGNQSGNVIDGVQYDHVFPIQVDTSASGGTVTLQIGYNNGENPFVAAQRFIDDHVLPQYHLRDIADYIQQRVGQQGMTIGASSGSGGTSVGTTVATTGVPLAQYEHVPAKSFLTFPLPAKSAATTLEKIQAKIMETNRLSEPQLDLLKSVVVKVGKQEPLDENEVELLHLVLQFPLAEAFPALDLARIAILSTQSPFWETIIVQALTMVQQSPTAGLDGPAAIAIPMLSLRLFANAIACDVPSHFKEMVSCAKTLVGSSNKNVRLSVATLLYNACLFSQKNPPGDSVVEMIDIANAILSNRSYEGEAIYRTLVAVGTLIQSLPVAKEVANAHFLASKVEMAASPHSTEAKKAAKEVYNLLQ